jgi:hypothetical protein
MENRRYLLFEGSGKAIPEDALIPNQVSTALTDEMVNLILKQ